MIGVTTVSAEATKQVVTASVLKQVCCPYCITASVTPRVNVTYSVASTKLVADVLYVKVKAEGTVSYIPKGSCSCNTKVEVFTDYFVVSFSGVTETTATVEQDLGYAEAAKVKCGIAHAVAAYNFVTIKLP